MSVQVLPEYASTTMKYIEFIQDNKISNAVASVMDGFIYEIMEAGERV